MGEDVFDGRRAFEELLSPSREPTSALEHVLTKRACQDQHLLEIAQQLSPEDPYSTYERLGGGYTIEGIKLAKDTSSRPKGGLKPGVTLFPHQNDAVEKIIAKGGNLLLSHPVGSGKTLTSIAAFEEMRRRGMASRALVVAPASLRTNFVENGIKKFTTSKGAILGNAQEAAQGTHVSTEHPDPHAQYHVVSYELFRADPKKYIDAAGADTVIYDELHRAKNEGVLTSKAIKDARQYHKNFIGMTGSIVSNTPADIVPLVDAMTDGKHLLGNKTTFESRFVKTEDGGAKSIRNLPVMKALLGPYVHHVDQQDLNNKTPKKIIEEVRVDMSPHQTNLYRFVTNQLDPVTKLRLKAGISDLNSAAFNDMFAKLLRLRQVSNAIHTMDARINLTDSAVQSPKIKRVLDDIEEHIKETPDAQAVIHTNMIQGGVDVITAGLKARGIDHALFIGKGNPGVTEKFRQQGVKEFQEGKKKVIVLSAAGGEGLDLPNATFMAMVDGHFNPERISQAEARGIRSGGQAHRAEDKRQVTVRRYVSVLPHDLGHKVEFLSNIWDNISPNQIKKRLEAGASAFYNPFKKAPSTDEWVYSVAKRKDRLNQAVHGALRKTSSVALYATHEDFEADFIEKLSYFMGGAGLMEKEAGPALKSVGKFMWNHPTLSGGVLGGVAGAGWGALLGGTAPRTKAEAERDPGAQRRNRLSSTIGGALSGGLAGAGSGEFLSRGIKRLDPDLALAGLYGPLASFATGPLAGRAVADLLWAPKRTIPQSVRDVLGDKTHSYSDKALFEKYWAQFGKELEEKGIEGKISDPELEQKFTAALGDLYREAATVKPTSYERNARMDATGKLQPKPSKLKFWLTQGIPSLTLSPLLAAGTTLAMSQGKKELKQYATRKGLEMGAKQFGEQLGLSEDMAERGGQFLGNLAGTAQEATKDRGMPGWLSGALTALPLAVTSGATTAKTYRDMYLDPGVESVASKADVRKRAKFSDEQLQKLLRGMSVDELKVKQHLIK